MTGEASPRGAELLAGLHDPCRHCVVGTAAPGARIIGAFGADAAVAVQMVTILLTVRGAGWGCPLGPQDQFALGMVFVARNAAVVAAVGDGVQGTNREPAKQFLR